MRDADREAHKAFHGRTAKRVVWRQMGFKCTPEEHSQITQYARSQGQSVADWLRELALREIK